MLSASSINAALLLLCCTLSLCHAGEVDPLKTEVYGVGLEPHLLTLPVRYFFIRVRDTHGNRVNHSVGEVFKVQVEGDTSEGTYCRVWAQVLDRHDGTYVARYRTYSTCHNSKIHVLYRSQHVALSPYRIPGPIQPDHCNCPVPLEQWLDRAACDDSFEQIDSDLQPFERVDMLEVLKVVKERFHQPAARSFCHYVVKDNEVYRDCYGQHVAFNMFMDAMLLSMARKMRLPDTQFVINLGDWPLVRNTVKPLVPVFSWCGSHDTADIVLPTYDLTEATLEMMGRVSLDMLSVSAHGSKVPWADKTPRGFFRGRDSRQERLDLIALARQRPDLLNASLTNFFFFRDKEAQYGPKQKHVSFFDFFTHKYQVSLDGTVAAYRLPYLLAGSGAVLKQRSPYYEHFYSRLQPGVHYIPFERDLSDLLEKLEWAASHDEEVRAIGEAGRRFAREKLLPVDVFCYHARLLQAWSRRLTRPALPLPSMTPVPQLAQEGRYGACPCELGHRDEL